MKYLKLITYPLDPSTSNDWSTIFNISKITAIHNDHNLQGIVYHKCTCIW